MMKVVIDTNILISSLLNPDGSPAKIINLVLDERIIPCFDNRIIKEYIEVLKRDKFKFDELDIRALVNFFIDTGEFIVSKPLNIRIRDKDDLKFYEVYISANAKYLITGNIKDFVNIKDKGIVTPNTFLELFLDQ